MADTRDFKAAYTDLLATLYHDIESVLTGYHDCPAFSPAEYDALWRRFEALRARLATLKCSAAAHSAAVADELASAPRRLLTEIDQLLDIEQEGDDWETYVGAAMMHAENRIYDEAHWVARWV
jgi:hypothetical protein